MVNIKVEEHSLKMKTVGNYIYMYIIGNTTYTCKKLFFLEFFKTGSSIALLSKTICSSRIVWCSHSVSTRIILFFWAIFTFLLLWTMWPTLMFLPPIMTLFICSRASCAASGISYSMKAKPLCLLVTGSHERFTLFIGPKGIKACFIVSSLISKFILPTYIL